MCEFRFWLVHWIDPRSIEHSYACLFVWLFFLLHSADSITCTFSTIFQRIFSSLGENELQLITKLIIFTKMKIVQRFCRKHFSFSSKSLQGSQLHRLQDKKSGRSCKILLQLIKDKNNCCNRRLSASQMGCTKEKVQETCQVVCNTSLLTLQVRYTDRSISYRSES